jgi:hypothetical protein
MRLCSGCYLWHYYYCIAMVAVVFITGNTATGQERDDFDARCLSTLDNLSKYVYRQCPRRPSGN